MMVLDADDEVMSRSGGLYVWVEIGERSASLKPPERAASRIVVHSNQHCFEGPTTYLNFNSLPWTIKLFNIRALLSSQGSGLAVLWAGNALTTRVC